MRALVLTQSGPIRGQYPGHVITLDQSEGPRPDSVWGQGETEMAECTDGPRSSQASIHAPLLLDNGPHVLALENEKSMDEWFLIIA